MKCYKIEVKGILKTPIQSEEDMYEELYHVLQDVFGPDVCGLSFNVEQQRQQINDLAESDLVRRQILAGD